jgi:nucleotide-binding universal stress UspA family protein
MSEFDLIGRVLVPTDGSQPSLKAARYAAKLARMVDARVKIVHVMEVAVPGAREPVELDGLNSVTIQVEDEERIKRRAMDVMNRTKKCFVDEGVPVETEFFLSGNVAEVIVETAGEEGFDLIVMGSRGLGGLQHLMLGSVAEAVSRRAPCPVLIVR